MDSIYKLIKMNRIIQNHHIKYGYVFLANVTRMRHLFVRFDPVFACNLSCMMCYFSDRDFRRNHKGIFTREEIERIAGMFFPRSLQVQIGCAAEPTLYKNFTDLVRLAKSYKVPSVKFISNAQVFTADHIDEFIHYKLDELMISTHGVQRETYERFMVGASFDRFQEVLETLDARKKKRLSPLPRLRFNYTVNPDNLQELSRFFEVYGRYDIRVLQVRPVFKFEADTGYQRQLDSGEIRREYEGVTRYLIQECKKRNISLLINTLDPTYQAQSDYQNVVLKAVERYISPEIVWRKDFDWRNETYDEYCQRIDWVRYLWYCLSLSKTRISEQILGTSFVGGTGTYQARFDVI